MKTKVERFVDRVEKLKKTENNSTIKALAGDSTQNHRTPTVSQIVNLAIYEGNVDLAMDLTFTNNYLLKNELLKRVRRNNNRTDAYDINEFLKALRRYVVSSPNRRKEVNQLITNH